MRSISFIALFFASICLASPPWMLYNKIPKVQLPVASALTWYGASFDGATTYLHYAADLTGVSDGQQGTLSFWCNFTSKDANTSYILCNSTARIKIYRGTGNNISFEGKNSSGTTILNILTNAKYSTTNNAGWHHIIASWDLSAAKGYIYVDGSADISGSKTLTNDTIDYAGGNHWYFGHDTGTGSWLGADVCEVWFNTTYYDLTQASNVQLFRTSGGKPVTTGLPSALVYFSTLSTNSIANIANNCGTGGGFTKVGTINASATQP